jgi:hypothetical protein
VAIISSRGCTTKGDDGFFSFSFFKNLTPKNDFEMVDVYVCDEK